MGFGRIGREMAKRARAFNMKILYYDKIQFPREVEEEYGAEYAPLHKLLTFNSIEWIRSCFVPSIPETRLLSIPLNGFLTMLGAVGALGLTLSLSIPLNGFLNHVNQCKAGFTQEPFNSIEWIPSPHIGPRAEEEHVGFQFH